MNKCNRCHVESSRPERELCGRTDAWGAHPCNGILLTPKTHEGLRASVRAAIMHMERLSDHYAHYTNQTPLIKLQRDLNRLKEHEHNL